MGSRLLFINIYCYQFATTNHKQTFINKHIHHLNTGAYLRKIVHMASTEIALNIYNLIIIIVSPDIHVYVYYKAFAKLLQEREY